MISFVRTLATTASVILIEMLLVPVASLCQTPPRACLSIAERHFGKRAADRVALYEMDKDYALQIGFGKGCEIREIKVAPKYVWQHVIPEWIEHDNLVSLSLNQYDELITRISRFKRLGHLKKASTDTITVVTNSKTPHWEEYDNAFVRRTEHYSPRNNPRLIFLFSIYFLRPIQGKVIDSKWRHSPGAFQFPRVEIGDHWYLIPENEFRRLRIGKRTILNVAGPVD